MRARVMPPKKRSRCSSKANDIPRNSVAAHRLDHSGEENDSRGDVAVAVGDPAPVACAGSSSATSKLPPDLEGVVMCSSVIAPDVSGIRCVAVHPSEREMVVVRENGSMVLYGIDSFQNVPHFLQIRHTGGCAKRTVTRARYLPCTRSLFVAAYLSGQLVVYCGETLSPLHVHQRTGGAVWDFCIAGEENMYVARADGSWQHLRIEYGSGSDVVPNLTLQRIIPKVPGADRALSVCCSLKGGIAAGTDDAGNVVVWRLPRERDESDGDTRSKTKKDDTRGARSKSLSDHEALWTSRLPKGMALCCAIIIGSGGSGSGTPFVAVGTSMGDVVLFDAQHGHAVKTFTHHKGPISTLVSSSSSGESGGGCVLYASGWHESLRSYRCTADGEWYPAEVKRRTHYHEASELLVLQQRQLILSAARDGTIMYAPLASVFTSPAMYVSVATQQFAFAKSKNVLLQTRRRQIEAFRTDATTSHWTPLFAYKIQSKFYLRGLWCDERLHYVLFATDERAALLHVCWTHGAEDALALHHIEEVLAIPVGRGVLDCRFVQHGNDAMSSSWSCYVLLDDALLHVTLAVGYPVITTMLQTGDDAAVASSIRPQSLSVLLKEDKSAVITLCGLRGRLTCSTTPDGTIDPATFACKWERTQMAADVLSLRQGEQKASNPTLVALINDERYVAGIGSSTVFSLPRTLPHDTRFIARLPPLQDDKTNTFGRDSEKLRFLAVFSRGLLYVTGRSWHMLRRCSVEAAYVLQGDERVLLLLRNLEGMLEALPMCWKVRRFGN